MFNLLNFCFMETMGNYILSILKSSGSFFLSWGSHNFRELPDNKGLSFTVNGFVYKGKVSIIYNQGSDAFDVLIGNEKHENVYLDELAEVIDFNVEKNVSKEQYGQQVDEWLESDEFKKMFADDEN